MSLLFVAEFHNFYRANGAARSLLEYGFSEEKIHVLAQNRGEWIVFQDGPDSDGLVAGSMDSGPRETGSRLASWIGASAGSILALLGLLAGPDTIQAGSVLLTTLFGGGAGMAAGFAVGGLLGELIGMGIPVEEAEQYAETIRDTPVRVVIEAEPYMVSLLHELLSRYRPASVYEEPGSLLELNRAGLFS